MNETAGAGAPRDEEEREGRNRNGGRPEERAALARPVVALVMRGHENGDGDEIDDNAKIRETNLYRTSIGSRAGLRRERQYIMYRKEEPMGVGPGTIGQARPVGIIPGE